ncbi:MAG: dihydroorotate dehydrogenase electron transfer subunit [Lachnospiraceae bacterium]|nr:dihydroorotate dehydrogenase electron transfer subunit [Lachnospiraceae bacterium]
MKECSLEITKQSLIADNVYRLELSGDVSEVSVPGQFINISIEGFFLRRPISVCDVCHDDNGSGNGTVTILYKAVGHGTDKLSQLPVGTKLSVLTGLGNGFYTKVSGKHPILIGGGIGSAPMLMLSKKLLSEGKKVTAVLGFNSKGDVILEEELKALGSDIEVIIMTADGSCGRKGMVTDAVRETDCTYFYACGPMPMLKAVYRETKIDGELSFEERMGCGFGACVGCSMETASGVKRVCKDGPVFKKGDILWKD